MRFENTVRAMRAPLLLGLLGIAAAMPAWGGALTSAIIRNELSGCAAQPGSGTPSGSATSQAAIVSSDVGGCSMRASGFSFLGVVGASARTSLSGEFGASGGIFARAGGTWTDSLQPDLPEALIPVVADLRSVRLGFNLSATGGVSANNTPAPGGGILGNGSASIEYNFGIGARTFRGTQSVNGATGQSETEGQWGTVAGTIDLDVLVDFQGRTFFNPVSLSMDGRADASVGNFFQGGTRSTFANANFGSTLIWDGVVSAIGVDRSGNLVNLPGNFRMTLQSRDTGADYWNSARPQPGGAEVPAPATGALAAIGLAGLAWVRARRRPETGRVGA